MTPSHILTAPQWRYVSSAVGKKKKKYAAVCKDLRALFTPLVCSVDGTCIWDKKADCFIKRLGEQLEAKWERGYGVFMGQLSASFAIPWSTILCLRWSWVKWRSLSAEDGATIG